MELSSSFWDSLDSAEADYLKSLLEAVSLFQLQLRQNERLISEAKELLGEREAACERLRFGAARAKRAAASAAAAAAAGRQELRRLEAYEDVTSELRALQKQRGQVEAEEARAAQELSERAAQAQALAARLGPGPGRRAGRWEHLELLEARCAGDKLALQQSHAKEISSVKQQEEARVQAMEAAKERESTKIASEYAEEASELRASAAQLAQQSEDSAAELAAQELAARLREGAALRGLCDKAQQEVAELSSELRDFVDGVENLEELLANSGSENEAQEDELAELQRACHALERQNCKTQQAALARRPFTKLADISFSESLGGEVSLQAMAGDLEESPQSNRAAEPTIIVVQEADLPELVARHPEPGKVGQPDELDKADQVDNLPESFLLEHASGGEIAPAALRRAVRAPRTPRR
ncbi:unnamed protein product [Effrenium voratum]|uniref:Uncharacterized protein n=1 Tax=Effrenium voratum TaxID=2562239 RepID=A0AA36MVD6_9DINO|nr:unnamed protein product [Effrenium voratum]